MPSAARVLCEAARHALSLRTRSGTLIGDPAECDARPAAYWPFSGSVANTGSGRSGTERKGSARAHVL